jgi:hypothetical protein
MGRASPFPCWATEKKERDDRARVPEPVSAIAPKTQGPCSSPPSAKSSCTCKDSPVPSPPMLATVTANQPFSRFCRAGPSHLSLTDPSSVTDGCSEFMRLQSKLHNNTWNVDVTMNAVKTLKRVALEEVDCHLHQRALCFNGDGAYPT